MKIEKRKFKRVIFKNYVNIINNGKILKVKSTNVSRHGMFLNTNVFNVGDKLVAIFSVLLNIPLKKDIIVIRKNNNGIGIKFI